MVEREKREIITLDYNEYKTQLNIFYGELERKITQPKLYSPKEAKEIVERLEEMNFVRCPGGSVIMGKDRGIKCNIEGHRLNETPQRRIINIEPFYVAKFTVTNAEWEKFDPNHRRTITSSKDKSPVTCISYRRALRYIIWLNEQTGMNFCLPTEPQIVLAYAPEGWEYSYKKSGGPERHIQNVFRSFPEAYPEGEAGSTLEVDDPRVPVNYLGIHHAGGNVSVFTLGHYQAPGHWGANSDGCYVVVYGGNFRLCHFSTRTVARGIVDITAVGDTLGIRLVHPDPFLTLK